MQNEKSKRTVYIYFSFAYTHAVWLCSILSLFTIRANKTNNNKAIRIKMNI